LQIAFIPQDRERPGEVGEHDILVAVASRSLIGQPAAVAVEEARHGQRRRRRVLQVVGDKRAGAGRGGLKRHLCDRHSGAHCRRG
jgi:hypothetical protein